MVTTLYSRSSARIYLSVALITALGGALRFYQLGSQPIWLDEAFSLRFAKGSFYDLWVNMNVGEPNPPLYYTLQKFWLIFGQSEAAVRSFSAIIGTLTIPLLYILGRTLDGHRSAIIAAGLLATSAVHIQFSQEARAYTLLTAAAGLALYGLAQLLKDPDGARAPFARGLLDVLRGGFGGAQPLQSVATDLAWVAYIAGTTVALYSHNNAILLPILANVIAFIWWANVDRFSKGFFWNWFAANALILLIWSWWLRLVIYQTLFVMADFPRPIATPYQAFWTLIGVYGQGPVPIYGQPPVATNAQSPLTYGQVPVTELQLGTTVLIWSLALLGLWSWRRKPFNLALTATFVFGVPLITFLIGLWRPIFMGRVLLWSTIPLFLLIAAGLMFVRNASIRGLIVSLVLVIQLTHTLNYYRDFVKEPWIQITSYIESNVHENDSILFLPEFIYIPFQHYFRNFDIPQYYIRDPVLAGDGKLLNRLRSDRVWFVAFDRKDRDPNDLIPLELRRAGLELAYRSFPGPHQFEVFLFEKRSS